MMNHVFLSMKDMKMGVLLMKLLNLKKFREIEYDRTIKEKNGVCLNFSLTLSKEMEKLDIDHYIGIFTKEGQKEHHMVVLYYNDTKNLVVADLSEAIKYMECYEKKIDKDTCIETLVEFYFGIPINDYMEKCNYTIFPSLIKM